MIYKNALRIIKKYRKDRQFTTQYQAALAYFASKPQIIEKLDPLLQTLIQPGGISCEDCKALIPLILSDIPLIPEKQIAFTQHITNCPDCNLEFNELKRMGQEF
ncbi:MAG: hypothetical protein BGO39_03485 [Chloroflexi bacterium 54-19]|nr:MAG: hypothetical protein BGO39_03485 [Chloroflexi bacterium 54-19]